MIASLVILTGWGMLMGAAYCGYQMLQALGTALERRWEFRGRALSVFALFLLLTGLYVRFTP